MTLEGKTIVVTGALGVLGRAVSVAAEAAGARVARLDRAEAGEGGELTFLGLDLADEAAAGAAMRRVAEICGRIDGLVNVAGGFVWSPVAQSPAKVWEDMFRINLATALGATRAAMDYLKAAPGGASIVNIGANGAVRAGAGMGPYAASKAAVARLTESLAEELAGDGVRVNAVLPSIIDTPTNRREMPAADFASWVRADDLAQVVVFLLSDDAAAVTGAAIPVTRGRAGVSGEAPPELLIVGPSWLGDAMMMGALIQRLKADAPARRITVLTPAHLEDLVRRLPGVGDTLTNPFAHGALRLGDRIAFGRALKGRFAEAMVLPHSWKSALIPFFAGARRRTGFVGEARYGLLNDARPLDEAALPRMVDRLCLLAEPRGAAKPRESPAPTLVVDAAETQGALDRLGLASERPAIALCVGAEYGPAKRWPATHFAALARLAEAAGYETWAIGGPGDALIGQEAAALAPGALIDLTGRTTMVEAAALLAGARLVVCNDSGLMHVAAALGRPIVALYGSTSPAFTPPLSDEATILKLGLDCSPCFERVCPLGHFKCLNDLAPEQVWAAARRRLEASR